MALRDTACVGPRRERSGYVQQISQKVLETRVKKGAWALGKGRLRMAVRTENGEFLG